jgi:hypothetical protein
MTLIYNKYVADILNPEYFDDNDFKPDKYKTLIDYYEEISTETKLNILFKTLMMISIIYPILFFYSS